MKQLKEYLLEARATIGSLPFSYELFEKFITDAILNEMLDDSPYWEEMKEIISDKYGADVWRWFKDWITAYSLVENEMTMEQLYKYISKTPLDRLKKVMGAGGYGVVFDLGNDKVIKFKYKNSGWGMERSEIYDKFYNYCLNRKSKILPYVYKYTKNYILMEKLKPNTPKCEKYYDVIENKTFNVNGTKMSMAKIIVNNIDYKFTGFDKEVYEWMLELKKEMESYKGGKISGNYWYGDMKPANLGERKNGDIIYFDVE